MARTYDLLLRARGDTRDAERAMAQLQGKVRRHGRAISSVGRTLALGVTAPLVAMGAVGVRELAEIQKANAQTNAVLRSTGGIAGVSAKQVAALSQNLTKLSGVDDQVIQSGQNLLLTFTRVGAKGGVFDGATRAALDMSVALGEDMTASAMRIGKALNDPIRGMSALRRVGVSFTESQIATVKSLVDQGKVMDAQRLILRELNTEFGGSAEAFGKTLPGRIGRLKEDFAGLSAELVGELIPAFERMMGYVERGVHWFEQLSSKDKRTVAMFAGIAAAAGPAAMVVGSIVTASAALIPLIVGLVNPISLVAGAMLLWAGHTMKSRGALGRVMEIVKKIPDDFRYAKIAVKLLAVEFVRSLADMADSVLKLWGPLQKIPGAHQAILMQVRGTKIGLNVLADSMERGVRTEERMIDRSVKFKDTLKRLGVELRNTAAGGGVFGSAMSGVRSQVDAVISALAAARVEASKGGGGKGGGKRGRSGSVIEGRFKTGGTVSALGVITGSPSAGAVLAHAVLASEPTPKFLHDRVRANKALLNRKLRARSGVMARLRRARSKEARAKLRSMLESLNYEILGIASAIAADQASLNQKPEPVIEDIATPDVDTGESVPNDGGIAVERSSAMAAANAAMAQTATANLAGFVSSGDIGTALGASAYSSSRIGSLTIVFRSTVPYTQQQAAMVASMVSDAYANGGGALTALRNTKLSLGV